MRTVTLSPEGSALFCLPPCGTRQRKAADKSAFPPAGKGDRRQATAQPLVDEGKECDRQINLPPCGARSVKQRQRCSAFPLAGREALSKRNGVMPSPLRGRGTDGVRRRWMRVSSCCHVIDPFNVTAGTVLVVTLLSCSIYLLWFVTKEPSLCHPEPSLCHPNLSLIFIHFIPSAFPWLYPKTHPSREGSYPQSAFRLRLSASRSA